MMVCACCLARERSELAEGSLSSSPHLARAPGPRSRTTEGREPRKRSPPACSAAKEPSDLRCEPWPDDPGTGGFPTCTPTFASPPNVLRLT